MSNVGKLFKDTTVTPPPVYAVGKRGFLCVDNGDWIEYDSAFSSETFSHPAFEEVTVNA